MLGDELKKALEPIQASDELLEKTRRAIEQARIQQAQETLDKSVRKDARRTLFLKAMVPVACVLLVVGGLAVVLLPKLSDSKKDGGVRKVKEHNDAVNTVTADIDSILGLDHTKYSSDKLHNHGFDIEGEDSFETTRTSFEETEVDVSEDTTVAATEETDSVSEDAEDMYRYMSSATSIRADGHIVSVSGDRSGLLIDLDDSKTLTPRFKNGNNYQGTKNTEDSDEITGLYFDQETQILYITISHFDDSNIVPSRKYLYAILFKDGKLSEDGPELVCVKDY